MENKWIEHKSLVRPVGKGVVVDVKLRNGTILGGVTTGDIAGENWGMTFEPSLRIIAWRLHKPDQETWNGEGLPPVGCVCELMDVNVNEWLPVLIKYSSKWAVVAEDARPGQSVAVELCLDPLSKPQDCVFRPLRTESSRDPEGVTAHDARGVCAEYLRRLSAGDKLTQFEIEDWTAHHRIVEDENNTGVAQVNDHACTPCFTNEGACTGNCHVADVNREFDAAASVIQEYFPNGGRDYDHVESLVKDICLGKVPGISFRPGASVDPYQGLDEAAKPLMKWVAENCNPHSTVIVDCGSAILYTAEKSAITDEFIKD